MRACVRDLLLLKAKCETLLNNCVEQAVRASMEKKQVCATGRWSLGLRVSSVCTFIDWSPQSRSVSGSRLRPQMKVRKSRRCAGENSSSTCREHIATKGEESVGRGDSDSKGHGDSGLTGWAGGGGPARPAETFASRKLLRQCARSRHRAVECKTCVALELKTCWCGRTRHSCNETPEAAS
eukprot:6099216-Pleurochrysis_carterae.AAC.2